MRSIRRRSGDDGLHAHWPPPSTQRVGWTLFEVLWCVLLVMPALAGFAAAKGHGAAARIVGFTAGAAIGVGGLLASMLLVSALLAIIGPGEEAASANSAGRAGWRRTVDRIAFGVLLIALLSMPFWAAWSSERFVRWLHHP